MATQMSLYEMFITEQKPTGKFEVGNLNIYTIFVFLKISIARGFRN